MKDWNEADRRLVDWLKDRTDVELQRLLDAPDDGLTNEWFGPHEDSDGNCRACLEAWSEAFAGGGTFILCEFGLFGHDDGTVFRHIKHFVSAELLTRRVDRKALPAPREAAHA